MPVIIDKTLDIASTEAFASALKAKIIRRPFNSITIQNTHTTDTLQYKVLVTDDETGASGWAEDKAATDISGATAGRHVLTGPFVWVDIQIANKVSGQSPHANVYLSSVGI